jgi:Zn-dependent protease
MSAGDQELPEGPPVAPVPATPSEDASASELPPTPEEVLRRQTYSVLAAETDMPPSLGGAWLMLGTMALFALSLAGSFDRPEGVDFTGLSILVAVLLFHELGHWSAMRLFGYQDVRIFFIPFFGAAASGRKHAAPGWQQGVVLLAGPLPGIVAACALVVFRDQLPWQPSWLREATTMLLVLNVFNLLPFMPLDGGRLLQLTIFVRRPLLETLFRLFAAAGMGLGAWLFGSWVLGIIAGFMLLLTPIEHNKAKQRRVLREQEPDLPAELDGLSAVQRDRLYERARAVFAGAAATTKDLPTTLARMMRTLHEEAVTHIPGVCASLLLLACFGFGWLAVPGLVLWTAWRDPPVQRLEVLEILETHGEARACLDRALRLLEMAEADPENAEAHRAEAVEQFRRAQLAARMGLAQGKERLPNVPSNDATAPLV